MVYTFGNWTISSLVNDTISEPKELALPDLDYASDFVENAEAEKKAPGEVHLTNATGAALWPPEYLRYSRQAVSNVYNSMDVAIPAIAQMPVKTGVRVLSEVREILSAVNAVSGAEFQIPLKGWACFQIPTGSMITAQAVEYIVLRTLAALYPTGETASLVSNLARGNLNPQQS